MIEKLKQVDIDIEEKKKELSIEVHGSAVC